MAVNIGSAFAPAAGGRGDLLLGHDEVILFTLTSHFKFQNSCGGGYPGAAGTFHCNDTSSGSRLILTQYRIVFLASPPSPMFQSFTIPYSLLVLDSGGGGLPKLYTPSLFGSCTVSGVVVPCSDAKCGLPAPGKWQFAFDKRSDAEAMYNVCLKQCAEAISYLARVPNSGHAYSRKHPHMQAISGATGKPYAIPTTAMNADGFGFVDPTQPNLIYVSATAAAGTGTAAATATGSVPTIAGTTAVGTAAAPAATANAKAAVPAAAEPPATASEQQQLSVMAAILQQSKASAAAASSGDANGSVSSSESQQKTGIRPQSSPPLAAASSTAGAGKPRVGGGGGANFLDHVFALADGKDLHPAIAKPVAASSSAAAGTGPASGSAAASSGAPASIAAESVPRAARSGMDVKFAAAGPPTVAAGVDSNVFSFNAYWRERIGAKRALNSDRLLSGGGLWSSVTDDVTQPIPDAIYLSAFATCHKSNGHVLAVPNESGNVSFYDTSRPLATQRAFDPSAPTVSSAGRRLSGLKCHADPIFDLTWLDGDTKLVTASGDDRTCIWDVASAGGGSGGGGGRCLTTLYAKSKNVKSVRVCPLQASVIVAGTRNGDIHMFDTRVPGKLHIAAILQSDPKLKFSGDLCTPVCSIENAHSVHANTKPSRRPPVRDTESKVNAGSSVTAVVWFRDSEHVIASGGADGSIKVWDFRVLRRTKPTKSPKSSAGTPIEPARTLAVPTLPPSLAASNRIAAPLPGRPRAISSLDINRSGTALLAASATDNRLFVYDLTQQPSTAAGGGGIHTFVREGSGSFWAKARFSHCERYLASGCRDGGTYIFDTRHLASRGSSGEPIAPIRVLAGHNKETNDISWCAADFGKFASASDDGTVRVWTLQPFHRRERRSDSTAAVASIAVSSSPLASARAPPISPSRAIRTAPVAVTPTRRPRGLRVLMRSPARLRRGWLGPASSHVVSASPAATRGTTFVWPCRERDANGRLSVQPSPSQHTATPIAAPSPPPPPPPVVSSRIRRQLFTQPVATHKRKHSHTDALPTATTATAVSGAAVSPVALKRTKPASSLQPKSTPLAAAAVAP